MNEMVDELLADARERMGKSVESTRNELGTVRTGRASPHLLDRIQVDYYGAATPLNQLANVATTGSRSRSRQAAISRSNCDAGIGSPGTMPRIRRASSSKFQMNSRPVACFV